MLALVNPITWHVDVLRFATIGLGDARTVATEAAAFAAFTLVVFVVAVHSSSEKDETTTPSTPVHRGSREAQPESIRRADWNRDA